MVSKACGVLFVFVVVATMSLSAVGSQEPDPQALQALDDLGDTPVHEGDSDNHFDSGIDPDIQTPMEDPANDTLDPSVPEETGARPMSRDVPVSVSVPRIEKQEVVQRARDEDPGGGSPPGSGGSGGADPGAGSGGQGNESESDEAGLDPMETLCGSALDPCDWSAPGPADLPLPVDPFAPTLGLPDGSEIPDSRSSSMTGESAPSSVAPGEAPERADAYKDPVVFAWLAATTTVLVSGVVVASTHSGGGAALLARWAALVKGFLLVQYARLRKEKVLDHAMRRDLHRFLRENPGAWITRIQEGLGTSLSTTRHHLRVLETHGLVVGVKSGRRRCFFTTDDGRAPGDRETAAALSSRSMMRVYEAIRDRPGIRQKDLAVALGVSRTTVLFHVRRLRAAGIVHQGQKGRETVYFPADPDASLEASARCFDGRSRCARGTPDFSHPAGSES